MEGIIMAQQKSEVYLKIAEKAYSYYVSRGFKHGDDMQDWLRAEREILKSAGKSSTQDIKTKSKR